MCLIIFFFSFYNIHDTFIRISPFSCMLLHYVGISVYITCRRPARCRRVCNIQMYLYYGEESIGVRARCSSGEIKCPRRVRRLSLTQSVLILRVFMTWFATIKWMGALLTTCAPLILLNACVYCCLKYISYFDRHIRHSFRSLYTI